MGTDKYLASLEQAMCSTPAFDGIPARLVHLQNAKGMKVSFMDIGATWLSCTLPLQGEQREVLLRAPDMAAHRAQKAYFGATVGRYANRIDASQFTLDGQVFRLSHNEGDNILHGGVEGFDKRRWVIERQSAQFVTFGLESRDGDQGFPGNLKVSVTFTLTDDNAVVITYDAVCDKTCPVNLTNHAYFNLMGEGSGMKSLDHLLMLHATHYLPTREDLIPTGEWKAVSGTSFDFTALKAIGRDFLADNDQKIAGGYDHAFIFGESGNDGEKPVALLATPDQSVTMAVATTKPAIQFYAGNFLEGTPGASGTYTNYDGLALETQCLPDGPNHPEWGEKSGMLEANTPYRHQTRYHFTF